MRKITIVALGLLAATVIACSSGSKSGNKSSSGSGGSGASAAALNQAVRDGKFEFTVSTVHCGATTIGQAPLNQTAQGQFCEVDVTVKNIGTEAQTFDGGSQKAYDASGAQYSDDTTAESYANESNQTFLQQINPGNQVKGMLVYDVPKTAKITTLELHDSAFSGGVKVKVG